MTRNFWAAACAALLLSGCAINMPVPIRDPAPSALRYEKAETLAPATLVFKDEQSAGDKAALLSGRIPMQLLYQGKPFDAAPWIAQNTVKELAARGLPVTLGREAGKATVAIKRVHIENHRVSGFSPFVTLTSLRADLVTPGGTQRVTAYLKRGKVPVWSFDEVIDPTYNDPLGLLTKELAAKINREVFGQVVGDDQVRALIDRLNKDSARDDAYLDVYQLGFGNNPVAIPELVKLTSHSSEYVRLAALSSLGILKATGEFALLARIYEGRDGIWQDRAMALKAIGDFATPESRAYLQKAQAGLQGRSDLDAVWTRSLLSLYLEAAPAVTADTSPSPIASASVAPASVPATSLPATAQSAVRQVVGAEFKDHLRNLRSATIVTAEGSSVRLDFRPGGDLWLKNLRAGGSNTIGTYTIREDVNQLCLFVKRGDWSMFRNCYHLFDLGNNRFAMRSASDNHHFAYHGTGHLSAAEDAYRVLAATAGAQSTPTRAPAPLPAAAERQIIGDEFDAHFHGFGKVQATSSSHANLTLELGKNGWLLARSSEAMAPSSGSYRLKRADAQICLILQNQLGADRWKMLQDCYRLFDQSGGRFVLRSVSDTSSISYAR